MNADSTLGKKKAPETEKARKVAMELIELSDSEEESIDPLHSSKDWANPCYLRPGKSDAKADNMLDVKKKKALETKEPKKEAKVPDKPKRPARSFYVKRGQRSSRPRDPHKPKKPASAFFIFMMDFRKKFKEENPSIKSVAAVSRTGGEKWKQLPDAEKAPYVAKAKKRMEEYHKNNDAYKKRVAAGDSEEDDSYKSMSKVDEEEGDDD